MSQQRYTGGQSSAPDSLRRSGSLNLDVRINNLVQMMHERLEDGKLLNLSEPSHIEIAEALHVLAYESSDAGAPVSELRVSYGDGAKPYRIQVRCLRKPRNVRVDAKTSLHIGTLSFRHLDYDNHVDVYLIRDRETRSRSPREI